LRRSTSNDVLSVKIGPTRASVDLRKNCEKSAVNIRRIWVYISGIWGAKRPGRIEPEFFGRRYPRHNHVFQIWRRSV